MSFRMDIQSSPIRRGTIGAPALGSWAANPVPTMSGVYTGAERRTLIFATVTAGVIGTTSTIVVLWTDGTLTGYLNLGTDHGYTAGTAVLVTDGVYVAFAAGTFASPPVESFTVAVVPVMALRDDHVTVVADGAPVDIVPSFSRTNMDLPFVSWKGHESLTRAAILRNAAVTIDYLDAANYNRVSYMESERHTVTLGEDYDETTALLWRGGGEGVLPFVGTGGVFARGSVGSYVDPKTGRVTHAASGSPRRPAGVVVGRSTALDGGTSNKLIRSSAQSGTTYFTASGVPTTAVFDPNVIGPCDLDDANIPAAFKSGCLRVAFTAATVGTDNANSDNITLTPTTATTYVASVWLRGHNTVKFTWRSGVGAASTTRGTANVTLTDSWVRYECVGTTAGGDDTADITITSTPAAAVCWAWGWQLEPARPVATSLVITNGTSVSRAAETLTFPVPIPGWAGTLGFWIYWGGDSALVYQLFAGTGVAGTERFSIRYDAANSWIEWHLSTSGPSAILTATDLAAGTWYHMAFTWDKSSSGDVAYAVYLNGALGTSGPSSTWSPTYGTGVEIAGSLAGVTPIGTRFAEVRMDAEAKSATEIADWYNRGVDDRWLNNTMQTYGRLYRLGDLEEVWRFPGAPNQVLARATLREVNNDPDSTLVQT